MDGKSGALKAMIRTMGGLSYTERIQVLQELVAIEEEHYGIGGTDVDDAYVKQYKNTNAAYKFLGNCYGNLESARHSLNTAASMAPDGSPPLPVSGSES